MNLPALSSLETINLIYQILLVSVVQIISTRMLHLLCFMWKELMGNEGGVSKEGMTNLANTRSITRRYIYSSPPGGTDGWGWPGAELIGKYRWVTLQIWLYRDVTVNGTLETLRHNWNAHCWHWMKGEAPTTRRVGGGGFQYISILILSMTLWAIRYLHFWLSVRQS